MVEAFGPEVRGCTAAGRPALDLPTAVAAALAGAGVAMADKVDRCTGCGGALFSHRVRAEPERQVMIVWRGAVAGSARARAQERRGRGGAVTGAEARADEFADRMAELGRRIASAAPDPGGVAIVAVTKGFGPEAVRAARAAGISDIGENYASELLAKAGALSPDEQPVWHFLGAVQRNKLARLAPVVSCWQSVSRREEGMAIARRCPGATVLVQVDIAGQPGRLGQPPERVPELVAALSGDGLAVAGSWPSAFPGRPKGRDPASDAWCGWPTSSTCRCGHSG